MKRLIPYLRLMRPANIVTAMADVLAGFAISGSVVISLFPDVYTFGIQNSYNLLWLLFSTAGLYGGGVVFNDVFDVELDKKERPERPIPSGSATLGLAILLGSLLFIIGIFSAFMASDTSGLIACAITILALFYDRLGKHHPLFGPVNMGACRGLNLLLGVSAVPERIEDFWYFALVPIVFIAAITMISRGEVHGGNKTVLMSAVFLYFLVIVSVIVLNFTLGFTAFYSIPFLILFGYMVYPPLYKAIKEPQPKLIMNTVKAGVISLIAMDAAIAAGFAGWIFGLMILLLLPLSRYLSKLFAVT